MKTPKLGREVMAAVGRELRLLYREIIVEGVPERFAAILRRLDEPVDSNQTGRFLRACRRTRRRHHRSM
jgi:Anti-sigma factor NepR